MIIANMTSHVVNKFHCATDHSLLHVIVCVVCLYVSMVSLLKNILLIQGSTIANHDCIFLPSTNYETTNILILFISFIICVEVNIGM